MRFYTILEDRVVLTSTVLEGFFLGFIGEPNSYSQRRRYNCWEKKIPLAHAASNGIGISFCTSLLFFRINDQLGSLWPVLASVFTIYTYTPLKSFLVDMEVSCFGYVKSDHTLDRARKLHSVSSNIRLLCKLLHCIMVGPIAHLALSV